MKKHRIIGAITAICGVVFFGSRSCTKADAAEIETRTLTVSQTRALLGDTLPFTYYNGTDYVTGELEFLSSVCVPQWDDIDFGYSNSQRELFNKIVKQDSTFLCYYGNFPDISVGQGTYYSAEINPRIEFSGVNIASFVAGFSCAADYNPRTNSVPFDKVEYFINGNKQSVSNFYKGISSTSSIYVENNFHFRIGSTTGRYFTLAPVDYDSDSQAIISNIVFSRQGNLDVSSSGSGGLVRFLIQCPTLTTTGNITASGGSVGADLTATNIKLDTIINLLSQIAQNEQQEDNSDEYDDDSPLLDVPDWFENAIENPEVKAQFDLAFDGSPIFGAVPSVDSSSPYLPTAGGQLFLPDGVNVPKIEGDPTQGGIMTGSQGIMYYLSQLLKANPAMSKLITIFLAASIASWLIFRGRGS